MGMKMSSRIVLDDVKTLEKVFLSDLPPYEWNVKIYSPTTSTAVCCHCEPIDGPNDRSKRRRILRDSWIIKNNEKEDNNISIGLNNEKEMIQVVEECVEACIVNNNEYNDTSQRNDNSLSTTTIHDDDGLPSSCIMPRTSIKRPRDF